MKTSAYDSAKGFIVTYKPLYETLLFNELNAKCNNIKLFERGKISSAFTTDDYNQIVNAIREEGFIFLQHIHPYSADCGITGCMDDLTAISEMLNVVVPYIEDDDSIVVQCRIDTDKVMEFSNRDLTNKLAERLNASGYHVEPREAEICISVTVFQNRAYMGISLIKDNVSDWTGGILFFSKENIIKFEELTKFPHGLILVTGPTGSGKSTTLYTMLNEINNENDNIMTIEDPVEYLLPGLNQIQVNPKAGLTFASALRSVLRQDPDVIMIGEIRDQETARMAIRAAITGHLVLSTVHTKDAAGAITRLVDMGVEPYLLADGLVGIISQRLVRRICLNCKEEYLPEEGELKSIGLLQKKGRTFFRGAGCVLCNNTGYRDRIAIHEILMVTKTIREMIVNSESTDRIKMQAKQEGMKTIFDQGLDLVKQGITTFEEIVSLLYGID